MELKDYQTMAINKFSKLKVGALFMDKGTGKTLTTINLIEFNKNNIDLVLWVAPASTINNLKNEIGKWDNLDKYKIMSYETIARSDKKYLDLLELIKNRRIFLVADESIFIKNEETKSFKRLIKIGEKAKYKLILNGTPIVKNEWDLYNQLYFLSPKIIGMERSEFLNTFFKRIDYKKKNQKAKTIYKISEINIDYLYKLIEPYIIKVDFNFDKEINERDFYITSSTNTNDCYNVSKKKIKELIENYESKSIMQEINKIIINTSTDINKQKAVADYVKNKQIIVYCHFIEEVEQIKKQIDCLIITGKTKNSERSKIIEEFKQSSKPLLFTYGTGSFGLDLQFCNEIVFSGLTFDYGKLDQAKGRIKRIGQKSDIKYTYFKSALPIQNMIDNNISKKELLDLLLENRLKEYL